VEGVLRAARLRVRERQGRWPQAGSRAVAHRRTARRHIDHIKPGDIPTMHRALGAYLSARDQTQQAIKMVETPDITDENGIPFLIVYGISGNTHRFWSLASARRKIGYTPEDDSQVNFADKIAAIARAAKR